MHEKDKKWAQYTLCYKGACLWKVQGEADSQSRQSLPCAYFPFIVQEGHWVNQAHYSSFVCQDTQGCGHLDKRPYCSREEIISSGSKKFADPKPKRRQQVSENRKHAASSLSALLDHLLLLARGLAINCYPELATILISPERSNNESLKERRLWQQGNTFLSFSYPTEHTHTHTNVLLKNKLVSCTDIKAFMLFLLCWFLKEKRKPNTYTLTKI